MPGSVLLYTDGDGSVFVAVNPPNLPLLLQPPYLAVEAVAARGKLEVGKQVADGVGVGSEAVVGARVGVGSEAVVEAGVYAIHDSSPG